MNLGRFKSFILEVHSMYTLFSRIALNAQNIKNTLDYAEKYCYSFHLTLLRCKNIIDNHITFTESESDITDRSISDIISIDDEELSVLVESLTKLDGMSFTYEKLHDIIDDLVKIYYDKTHDDAYIKMRESYHYMCASGENHEMLRRLYIDEHCDMLLYASVLINSMQNDFESTERFSEECFDKLREYVKVHKDEVARKELERIMKSNLEDWETIFREYI